MGFSRMTVRLALANLIAAGLVVAAASSAPASIPLAIDRNDGYTFSGLETTSYAPRNVGPPFPVNPPSTVPPTTTPPSAAWARRRR
jgi:hypothetical protein